MLRKALLVATLLLLTTLGGCLSFLEGDGDADEAGNEPPDFDYDPSAIKVSGFEVHEATVVSFDGTELATVIYEPTSRDALPDGSQPEWPVVVLLHGWGFAKEQWQNLPLGVTEGEPPVDLMERMALQGFITVAYDARGFGQSTGTTTMAGPSEMADLDAVVRHAEDHFNHNGFVGAAGTSYGAGQSILGLVQNERIDAAAAHYGWTDLYDALLPGNVPKLAWAEFLYAVGVVSTGVTGSGNMLHDWYISLYSREGLDEMETAMDRRSPADRMGRTDKPLLVCQGMQETLFPQIDKVQELHGGFTRAYVFTGGHSALDAECFDRTMDWFLYYLRGIDSGVDDWPALETTDASDVDKWISYDEVPTTRQERLYLRAPDLGEVAYENTTFTIDQNPFSNPLTEPSAIWEATGMPTNMIPEQLRQDPAGVFFESQPFEETETVVSAPTLRLFPDGDDAPPWQVVGTIYKESGDRQQVVSHGALAVLDEDDMPQNGTGLEMAFTWFKVDMAPGDQLVLKLAPNDPSMYIPLLANYSVTFNGTSDLRFDLFTV